MALDDIDREDQGQDALVNPDYYDGSNSNC